MSEDLPIRYQLLGTQLELLDEQLLLLGGDLLVYLPLVLDLPLCPHDLEETLVTLVVLDSSVHALFLYLKLAERLKLASLSLLLKGECPTLLL